MSNGNCKLIVWVADEKREGSMTKQASKTRMAVICLVLLVTLEKRDVIAATPFTNCSELAGGGLTPSAPAVVTGVQSGFSILNVFVRGTDNRIYENAFTHSGFSTWSEVPGGGFTNSSPAAVFYNGAIRLFVRGIGNGIFENVFNGTSWSGWSEVPGGGRTLSGPAAVVQGGLLRLFVRGIGNGIFENDFNGSTWGAWSEVPGDGRTLSTPAAINYSGQLRLFVRGENNRIYENDEGGPSFWSGWAEVPGGGLTIAGPSALMAPNQPPGPSSPPLRLFVTGIDDLIYENDLSGPSGWSRISETEPLTPSAPAAIEEFSLAPALYITNENGRILRCSW
jgi:hypothetical protein